MPSAAVFQAIPVADFWIAAILKRLGIQKGCYPEALQVARLNRLVSRMFLLDGYFHSEARN